MYENKISVITQWTEWKLWQNFSQSDGGAAVCEFQNLLI